MVWLCPRGQSVLQFKNKQEFTEWKASNNTSANTSMSSKIGNYFIGDPVYLLKPYYLREYSTCSSNAELIFNNMLRSSRNPTECAFDRRMIPADKKLAVTLHFLKDTGSLLMTASIFGIALSTASKIIYEVCKAMTEHLGSKCIRLPKTEEEMIHKAS